MKEIIKSVKNMSLKHHLYVYFQATPGTPTPPGAMVPMAPPGAHPGVPGGPPGVPQQQQWRAVGPGGG